MMHWTLLTYFWLTGCWSVRCEQVSDHVVFSLQGSETDARQLALHHGLEYVSQVFPGSDLYHAVMKPPPESNQFGDREQRTWVSLNHLAADPRIISVDRQVYFERELRHVATDSEADRLPMKSAKPLRFNDPLYAQQWYLHGRNSRDTHHLNIPPVWAQGYTGRGICVAVLDDNVNGSNPDITSNYDPTLSADLGSPELVEGPLKKNPIHGTYCAAIIAAQANNGVCGVGVAFGARIGGVRLLVKRKVLDVLEAKALTHQLERVDIYSASWGPPDDGKHLGGPGKFASQALVRGVEQGRNGLGAIYVWASGNGGSKGDHCGYDSYASSIYTLTVGALTADGLTPYYSEACPTALTSLYVGGKHQAPLTKSDLVRNSHLINVVVPEMDGECRLGFQGTSAAAPLAAGIIALLLEANGNLTWRDVHHLVVLSSAPSNRQVDWQTNGAGLKSHPSYGFGALDATKLIRLGKAWPRVPPQISSSFNCSHHSKNLTENRPVMFSIQADCDRDEACGLPNYLEYVTVTMTVDVTPRGALTVVLRSPSGMISTLLEPRMLDQSAGGFRNWNLTSAQFWGEPAAGQWRLYFANVGRVNGRVASCSVTFYGFQ